MGDKASVQAMESASVWVLALVLTASHSVLCGAQQEAISSEPFRPRAVAPAESGKHVSCQASEVPQMGPRVESRTDARRTQTLGPQGAVERLPEMRSAAEMNEVLARVGAGLDEEAWQGVREFLSLHEPDLDPTSREAAVRRVYELLVDPTQRGLVHLRAFRVVLSTGSVEILRECLLHEDPTVVCLSCDRILASRASAEIEAREPEGAAAVDESVVPYLIAALRRIAGSRTHLGVRAFDGEERARSIKLPQALIAAAGLRMKDDPRSVRDPKNVRRLLDEAERWAEARGLPLFSGGGSHRGRGAPGAPHEAATPSRGKGVTVVKPRTEDKSEEGDAPAKKDSPEKGD